MSKELLNWFFGATVLAVLSLVAFIPDTAQAESAVPWSGGPIQITGSGTTEQGKAVTFVGTFEVHRFIAKDGKPHALGFINGTAKDKATGEVVKEIRNRAAQIPVTIPSGQSGEVSAEIAIQQVCEVLFLQLGPLDLNLLGLQIHLDQVTLEITANPQGGILGQLLCALAGGNNLPLNQIVALLNSILQILQGL